MNREAEFAAMSLPDRLRSITNEALWEYESDAIEAAAAVLEEAYRAVADLRSMTAAFAQASQMLAEQRLLEVHHHDVEAHAASFNEGWDKAIENAPHADDCTYLEEDVVEPYGTRISPNAHCNCWKTAL